MNADPSTFLEPHPPARAARRYHSAVRQRHAEEVRQRVILAAGELFIERGYAGARVEDIARRAGVAPQTVRAAFGTKRGILAEILRRATLGPAFDEILSELRQTPDPRQRLRMVARLARQVHESKEAELALLRGVGVVAPELSRIASALEETRRQGQQPLMDGLVMESALKPGLSTEDAADIVWALTGGELYRQLVRERSWTAAAYEDVLAQLLIAALLVGGQAEH